MHPGMVDRLRLTEARVEAMAEVIKDYCAISEYGDYIVKLSVFDDRGGTVQTGSSFEMCIRDSCKPDSSG